MATLEGIRIQNFRALKDVSLGKTFESLSVEALPRFLAVIGPNGSGKSTLMDAFGFLGDCLASGVEEACDRPHRGGFDRLRTRGQEGPIQFEVYYRHDSGSRPISYSLHLDVGSDGRPFVAYERLRQRRKGQSKGQPFSFLELTGGRGVAWAGQASDGDEAGEKKSVSLKSG